MKASELAAMRKKITEGFPSNPFTDTLFDVWARGLMPYEYDRVSAVLDVFIAADKWRPPLDDVIDALYEGPTAAELAHQAYKAIHRYGWPSEDRARAELPGAVWDIVESYGGWWKLCNAEDNGALQERLASIADRVIKHPMPERPALHAATQADAVVHVLRNAIKRADDL